MSKTKQELRTFIGEKMGEATMCWEPTPRGEFKSWQANEILDEVLQAIEKEIAQSNRQLIQRIKAEMPETDPYEGVNERADAYGDGHNYAITEFTALLNKMEE